MPEFREYLLGAGLLAAGIGISVATAGDRGIAARFGLLLAFAGIAALVGGWIVRAVRRVNRPADVAWTDGYEAGYDKGWLDHNAEARPNLVALPARVDRARKILS